jgi:hypothetical protein
MKKLKLFIFLIFSFLFLSEINAQSGLQQIIVEKYYISNATDSISANADLFAAGYSTGTLPVGSVTYRIFADLAPNWGVQAAYGVTGHPVRLQTTTQFFNHPNGDAAAGPFPTSSVGILSSGTTLLDSYFSCGGVTTQRFGVLKTEDNSAAFPSGGGANYIGVSSPTLSNNDPNTSPALTAFDGIYRVSSPAIIGITMLGDVGGSAVNLFTDGSTVGNSFVSTNSSWGVLGQQTGAFPSGTNRVLLGQFTTDGIFSYELNIQLRNTITFQTENYVSANPVNGEYLFPALKGEIAPPYIFSFLPASASPGTTVTINGKGFVGVSSVKFNGLNASSFSVINPQQITAVVPSGATTGLIAVVNSYDTAFSATTINIVSSFPVTVNMFIEGFYVGSGSMTEVVNPGVTDSIQVELHAAVSPYGVLYSGNALLNTSGQTTLNIPGSFAGTSCYIVVKHRNSIETWSKTPVVLNAGATFSFKN